MGLYSGGLIIGRIFASEIWGAYFREGFIIFFCGRGGGVFFGGGVGGGACCRNFTVYRKNHPAATRSVHMK